MTHKNETTNGEGLDARLSELERVGRGQRRWTRGAMLLIVIGALSLPFGAFGLGPVPNTFSSGGVVSASQINENFAYLQNAITATEGQVPTGTVAFFDLASCPTGWSEYTSLRGRVAVGGARGTDVGTPLGDGASRLVSEVPAHTHTTAGASLTVSTASGHTHSVDPATASVSIDPHAHSIDPPATTSSNDGTHNHDLRTEYAAGYGTYAVMGTVNSAAGDRGTGPIYSAGAHTHSVDIPRFRSNLVYVGGTVNIPATTSTSAGRHGHTATLPANTTGSTGGATVDVTMPYTQLLACRRN